MVDTEAAINVDGILFATSAQGPTDSNRNNQQNHGNRIQKGAVLVDRQQFEVNDRDKNGVDVEFDWQESGVDGKPPSRKRMLCYTMRRLFRTRMLQSFRNLEEAAELFQGEWCDLKQKGQQNFMNDINIADLNKEKQRQKVRKVLMQFQMRLGEQSK